MTQEKVSERVGKSRAAIANYLRLLRLPAQIQLSLQKKEIDMGHARALLSLESPSQQIKVYKEIMKNNYSVRKVEEMVKSLNNGDDIKSVTKTLKGKSTLPEHYENMKNRIGSLMGAKVQMACSANGKGKITIPFASEDDLARLMQIFEKIQ